MNTFARYTQAELRTIAKAMRSAIPGSPAYQAAQGAQAELERREYLDTLSKADTQEVDAVPHEAHDED